MEGEIRMSSHDFFLLEPCKSANGVEIKLRGLEIDLSTAESVLSKEGQTLLSGVVLIANLSKYNLTLYKSGRIMVKTEEKVTISKIRPFANKIIKVLKDNGALVKL